MAKKKHKKNPFMGDTELDLTPMIDVVFQLMIFFMIVTDMSATDYVELVMPIAKNAQKPEGKDKAIIIINIKNQKQHGKYFFMLRGQKLPDYKRLEKVIKIESKNAGKEPNTDAPGSMISKLKVVIRCDRNVEYGVVQDVFKACALNGVWKIAVGANQPSK